MGTDGRHGYGAPGTGAQHEAGITGGVASSKYGGDNNETGIRGHGAFYHYGGTLGRGWSGQGWKSGISWIDVSSPDDTEAGLAIKAARSQNWPDDIIWQLHGGTP